MTKMTKSGKWENDQKKVKKRPFVTYVTQKSILRSESRNREFGKSGKPGNRETGKSGKCPKCAKPGNRARARAPARRNVQKVRKTRKSGENRENAENVGPRKVRFGKHDFPGDLFQIDFFHFSTLRFGRNAGFWSKIGQKTRFFREAEIKIMRGLRAQNVPPDFSRAKMHNRT